MQEPWLGSQRSRPKRSPLMQDQNMICVINSKLNTGIFPKYVFFYLLICWICLIVVVMSIIPNVQSRKEKSTRKKMRRTAFSLLHKNCQDSIAFFLSGSKTIFEFWQANTFKRRWSDLCIMLSYSQDAGQEEDWETWTRLRRLHQLLKRQDSIGPVYQVHEFHMCTLTYAKGLAPNISFMAIFYLQPIVLLFASTT